MAERPLPAPDLAASLDGKQFVMVVPNGAVREVFTAAQRRICDYLPLTATYPVFPHVTLGSYADPGRAGMIERAVEDWAARQQPIAVETLGIETFPDPFRVVYLRCRATPSLAAAFMSLRARTKAESFVPFGPHRTVEEHVFHISLAYGDGIPAAEWKKIAEACCSSAVPHVRERVQQVRFAVFAGGEATRTFALRSSPLGHSDSGLS